MKITLFTISIALLTLSSCEQTEEVILEKAEHAQDKAAKLAKKSSRTFDKVRDDVKKDLKKSSEELRKEAADLIQP